ncbi:CpaF family protein [Lichenicola cladoniae]|uniref:CpaF family protein n=2 Tax=Lichenicola cladoniae TaxID=1484109 RepID=A0A6M8HLX4_9PROT|nr:CpaF family protein [Acetobacteraceae bacterium]QKE89383.1 CpaF family protein [Lichenicola cladoniae]
MASVRSKAVTGSTMFGRRRLGTEEEAPAEAIAERKGPTTAMGASAAAAVATGNASAHAAALADLRSACLARVDPAAIGNVAPERLTREVERLISEIATDRRIHINAREQRSLATELVDDMLGLGPLQPLLDDDSIADIMVNGPDRVFIEQRGRLRLSPVRFRNAAHVANICQRIASAVGRRIDESSPLVDARLRDGSRVNIVFPPLALDGPYLSIRKFGKHALTFEQLVENGAMTAAMAEVLQIASSARLNIIISGGTGSGKTTLMNALSRLIDHGERIVTIEDAAELRLQQPHVVRLETRPPSLEGGGEITQRDLVRNALRMRPDRVIIGEVRGSEAFDMLQAMNTGHDGSMSTIHANTSRDALTRIENMVQMGNMGLPSAAIRQQIVSAVDMIIQIERQRDGVRRLVQITEVCGMEGEVVILNDIFRREQIGEVAEGQSSGRYEISRSRPSFWSRLVGFGLDTGWTQAMAETAGG